MRLGDHDGIHWLVYIFPWWQPESTRGHVPLMWCAALRSGLAALMWLGRTLKKFGGTESSIFKVDKPAIQSDRIICLLKLLANHQFWEPKVLGMILIDIVTAKHSICMLYKVSENKSQDLTYKLSIFP